MGIYLKEDFKNLLDYLNEFKISNHICYGQRKYIIIVNDRYTNESGEIIVYVTDGKEQVKLNNYLRKRENGE